MVPEENKIAFAYTLFAYFHENASKAGNQLVEKISSGKFNANINRLLPSKESVS